MLVLALLPYIASLSISTIIGIWALRRGGVHGARQFGLVAIAEASCTLGYIFELLSPTLAEKIFWDNFQFIGTLIWPLALLSFATNYTGRRLPLQRMISTLLGGLYVLFMLLVYTDGFHHMVRIDPALAAGVPFDALVYEFGLAIWLFLPVYLVLILISLVIMAEGLIGAQPLYRSQAILVEIGIVVLLAGIIMSTFEVPKTFHRDLSPFYFTISNLIVGWALYHFRLFDLVPVARDRVLEQVHDCVFVFDVQNRVVDVNEAGLQAIGKSSTEVIGKSSIELFGGWGDLHAALEKQEQAHVEFSLDDPAGKKYFELNLSTLKDRRGRMSGRLVVMRDVSATKQTEAELRKRSEELEALNRRLADANTQLEAANTQLASANERLRNLSQIKDQFVSNVSHELRTPITNIQLYLDMLPLHPENLPQYHDVLQRENQRLTMLIEELLTLSRFDQGRARMKYRPIQLNDVGSSLARDRQPLAAQRQLQLSFHEDISIPEVLADEALISQAVSGLLTNALNYTPAGGSVTIHTKKATFDDRHWVGICISDNGPGIPKEEQERIFERFYRGKTGVDSHASGTGLGLAITKEIVDRHYGRLTLESEGVEGKGAHFTIWIPAIESREITRPLPPTNL